MIQQAEWVAGLQLAENDRKALANSLNQVRRDFEALRKVPLPNQVPLALAFQPAPWLPPAQPR